MSMYLGNILENIFYLKQDSIGPPKIHLGVRLWKVAIENGVKAWYFGSTQYIRDDVDDVEGQLKENNIKLPTKADTPIHRGNICIMCSKYVFWYIGLDKVLYGIVLEHNISWIVSLNIV